MPFGRYTVFRDGGEPVGTEEFRAAPGPMGWRYFSEVETKEPRTTRRRSTSRCTPIGGSRSCGSAAPTSSCCRRAPVPPC